MSLRIALVAAATAVAMTVAMTLAPASAQTPPAGAANPAPTSPQGTTAQPGDPFGQETTLTAKPMVYVKGTGVWDTAFQTITASFRKLHTYLDKEGLKADGLPMTIFTSTDDAGFQYEAAVPLAETPKNPPHGDIAVGQTPDGRALMFVHHGSYEELDDTYEAITNYLDEKRLEAKDLFIEQYVTDPATADPKKLTVNVYVLLK
jgi:effector-binding domain-containing protein